MFSTCFVLLLICYVHNTVQTEDVPYVRNLPSEVLFQVSKPAVLECVTENREDYISYAWEKNGKPFNWEDFEIAQRKNEGTLVFLSPQAEDEGVYQCFAESPAGVSSSKKISFKRTYIVLSNITVQTVTPAERRPFKLDCPIPDAYPKPTIVWEKRLISKPSIAYSIYNTRSLVSDEGTFYFTRVQTTDTSEYFRYVCVAKSPAAECGVPLAEYYVPYLKVDTLPEDHKHGPQYLSENLVGKVGEPTRMYCVSPDSYPRWFKGETNIKDFHDSRFTTYTHSSGRMFMINPTTLEDEGTYSCQYNYDDGPIQKYNINLKVVSAPKLKETTPRLIHTKQGEDVMIPCSMSGVPEVEITWSFNAKPVTNVNMSATNEGLSVTSVRKQDTGYYVCVGTNKYGAERIETYLRVE